jgi:hypothetical protein
MDILDAEPDGYDDEDSYDEDYLDLHDVNHPDYMPPMAGIIHLVNQTPIESYCKKQKTVETATYGSEFMVTRHACEQIMDIRYTLRMMGIPIDGPAWASGDNPSVITSSTIPQSTLNKRHKALSYHRVCESIAAKIMCLVHVEGKYNPRDILTKSTWLGQFLAISTTIVIL